MAIPEAAIIPPITVEPSTRRATAPEPLANQSGRRPKMKAKEVIRIGRRRRRAPSRAASRSGLPFSYSSLANSTIRIALFAVTQREFRTGDVLDGRDRVERHGVAAGVSHVKLANVFRVGAIIAFGLYIYLPCSSEPIEVVHKKTAHERLERLIDLAKIDPLLDDFVAIDLDENLRNIRQKGWDQRTELGPFAGCI